MSETRLVETRFETTLNLIILLMSIILIILGVGGLVTIITTYKQEPDLVLNYAYTFVYIYMSVLGIILYTQRKRIIVKRY